MTFLRSNIIHTTFYKPEANRVVERFHRVSKASSKAHINPSDWFSNLGWVLLGIRSMVNENHPYSSSEMLYGTFLRLPGEYFHLSKMSDSPSPYISDLHRFMKHMQTVRTRVITSKLTNLPLDLSSCSHVLVRKDGVQPPLQQPNRGPYCVLHRSDKVFTLELDRNIDNVCINRLKPANMLSCFNIGALEPDTLRDRPSDKGVATANSPPFSGPDSSEVSINAPLSIVPETHF